MNTEVISAEIQTNKTYIFSFSRTVVQYMIGFSKCVIHYPTRDHHVKEITIDLKHSNQSDNEVLVKPILIMKDGSENIQSEESFVTVVVIATIGSGNPNIYLMNNVKTDISYSVPVESASYLKQALMFSTVQFPDIDHHLCKYCSNAESIFDFSTFMIKGDSFISDHGNNSGRGQILASVIICDSTDQRVFCADFSSETIGNSGAIYLGEMPPGVDADDFQFAVFLNGFQVSFGTDKDDHHAYKIEVSAEISKKEIIQNNFCAEINLKSFLTDNGKHGEVNKTNIPHNSVSGFVVAFNNKVYQ